MSPIASTLRSRRNRPLLPPSSLTVTMAVSEATSASERLRPRSTTGSPVPPPSATIFNPRWRYLADLKASS